MYTILRWPMQMSVREARGRLASVLAAAERDERVTITRNGKRVAEFGLPGRRGGVDFDRLRESRKRLDIPTSPYSLEEPWRESFDDPAWTRELFGGEVAGDDDADKAA